MEIDRLESKTWLGEHLTQVASLCYQDLHAMRESGHKCFPPNYKIMNFFIAQYHSNLVKLVSHMIVT